MPRKEEEEEEEEEGWSWSCICDRKHASVGKHNDVDAAAGAVQYGVAGGACRDLTEQLPATARRALLREVHQPLISAG